MSGGQRTIIAGVLSALVLIFWAVFLKPDAKPQPVSVADKATVQETVAQHTTSENVKKVDKTTFAENVNAPEEKIKLGNMDLEIELTNKGAEVLNWKTLFYRQTTKKDSNFINLSSVGSLGTTFKSENFAIPEKPNFKVLRKDKSSVVFVWKSKEVEIKKIIKLPENGYNVELKLEVTNLGRKTLKFEPIVSWDAIDYKKEEKGLLSFLKRSGAGEKTAVFYVDGKVNRWKSVEGSKSEGGLVLWGGLEDRYFISAIIPRTSSEKSFVAKEVVETGKKHWTTSIIEKEMVASSKEKVTYQYSIFAGPKDRKALEKIGVGLDKSIDYGWFSIIAVPIFYLLKFFYGLSGNYGVAIILMTVLIRLLLHPINIKSLKSMKAMQKIQPQLKELQAKYKGDREKLNTETMKLFKMHKVNPMGGCLPMLLQFPVYIALYRVLWNSVELYHAPFFWFYKDLSAPDPYLIAPILMGIAMFLQQKLTPTATDPAQKKMMMIMPVMFTGFMLFLPVGLVMYIFVSTSMAVIQQYMYNKNISWWNIIGFKKGAKS